MTNEQARKVFEQAAAAHRANGDRDAAARLDLAFEFLTNSEFAAKLEEFAWQNRE